MVWFSFVGFPDPGWKAFYDSATPHSEKMPDPWDAVSGLDRRVCLTTFEFLKQSNFFVLFLRVDYLSRHARRACAPHSRVTHNKLWKVSNK